MLFNTRGKKKSQFTAGSPAAADTFDYVQGGVNKKGTIQQLLDLVGDVYGASLRTFEFESQLVASDIALDEYAIVEENQYAFYKITNDAATAPNVALTSGLTATHVTYLAIMQNKKVASYADLRALSPSDYKVGDVQYVTNDGIAGWFKVVTGSATDNGGTIITNAAWNAAGKHWERIYSGPVNVMWFGAFGDGSTDDRAAFVAADSIGDMIIYAGTYRVASALNLTNEVVFGPGAIIKPDSGIAVAFNGGVCAGETQIFDTSASGSISIPGQSIKAAWFGVSQENSDNLEQITGAILAAGGGRFVDFKAGVFYISDTISVPAEVILRGQGMLKTLITAQPGSTMDYMLSPTNQDGTQESIGLIDIGFDGNKNNATVSVANILVRSMFIATYLRNVLSYNTTGRGIVVSNGAVAQAGSGPIVFDNIWTNRTDQDGFVVIDETNGGNQNGLIIYNLTTENYGEGYSGLLLDGTSSTGLKTVSLHIINHHVEVSGDNRTGAKFDGVSNVIYDTAQIEGAAGTGCKGIHITNNAGNSRINIRNVTNINVWNPILSDDRNSIEYGGVNLGEYSTPGWTPDSVYQTLSYGTSINCDATLGHNCIIVISNSTGFTINAPTNAKIGAVISYEIVNASGGAHGTITWAAAFAYKDSTASMTIANNKRRVIRWIYRGSSIWAQAAPATGDM